MGIVQGITEFLPVSSSGHLVILQELGKLGPAKDLVFFDVILHLGSLTSICLIFFNELWAIAKGVSSCFRPSGFKAAWREQPYLRLLAWLILGTIPAALFGAAAQDYIESMFADIHGVGVALIINAMILFSTRLAPTGGRNLENLTPGSAVVVGLAQAVATFPGISRSGSTIVAGLWLGLDRETAGRFSFLLAIPIILGAASLKAIKLDQIPSGFLLLAASGYVASVISSLIALKLLLGFIRHGRLHWFGFYCMLVGVGVLFL